MVQKLNPSFVARFAAYLKKLLTEKKTDGTISADDFQGKVTDALNSSVKEEYGIDPAKWRTIATKSPPDEECRAAILARILHGIKPNPDRRITHYRTQAEIYTATNEPTLDRAKANHSDANMNVNGLKLNADDWKSKTNMLLPDPTLGGKKRQMAVDFEPTSAVYCGECWICRTDVMSYTGESTDWYDNDDNVVGQDDPGAVRIEGTTPCGDCEHVAAIMASYIAGMLKSGGFSKFYWASYYVACVECNRRKSNKIGVKLHATKGWEVDSDGVDAIVDAIFPDAVIQTHVSEYNPIRNALGKKYNSMSPAQKIDFRAGVYDNIASGTQTWCDAANEQMFKSKASSTMAVKFSEIIAAITVNLGIATKNLQKMKTKTVSKLAKGKTPSGKGNAVKAARPMIAKQPLPNKPLPNKPKQRTGGAPPDNEYTKEGGDDEYIIFSGHLTKGTPVDEAGTPVDEDIDEDIDEDDYALHLETIISTFMEWVISKGYISQLYDLYVIESDTFEMLIARLLHSMEEILISSHDIKEVVVPDIAAEPTAMVYEKEEVKQEPDAALPGPQTVTKEDAANLEQGSPPRKVPTQGSVQITPARVGSASQPSQESQNQDDMSGDQSAKTESAALRQNVFSAFVPRTGPALITPQKVTAPAQNVAGLTRMVTGDPTAFNVLTSARGGPAQGSALVTSFASIAAKPPNSTLPPDSTLFPTVSNADTEQEQELIFMPESKPDEPDERDSRKRSASMSTTVESGKRSASRSTSVVEDHGGSRLNKRHSKNKSQTHNQKNRTKRVSYIKHKQTRKNQHSRKTK